MPPERGIVHQRPELPPVGARRVQANERNAGAGFLHVEPMLLAVELKAQVAPDGGLEVGNWAPGHQTLMPLRRGARQGQQLLEVPEIGHEWMLIALQS